MLNLGETSEPSPLPLLEDTSGNTGTPGEIADKTVDKDCVYEVLPSSGAAKPSNEDIPGRISISSDDSTCSSLSLDHNQFYYFYQGMSFVIYLQSKSPSFTSPPPPPLCLNPV